MTFSMIDCMGSQTGLKAWLPWKLGFETSGRNLLAMFYDPGCRRVWYRFRCAFPKA